MGSVWDLDTNSGNVFLYSQPNPGTIGVAEDTAAAEPCLLKPLTGNQVLKAQFSHQRTHNKQTLVRPCGVIYAHATMFGTEAVLNFFNTCTISRGLTNNL